ncbi:DNA repair protein RecO [Cognatitamlana onchidii]|uniref:DNA repair protein RecO n=1 Tax=Cognatitamlana onchidii TaxID=2562860 RepID=UPI0010A69E31|nr:DNA repair protein RecO [Algibacter onchidii]
MQVSTKAIVLSKIRYRDHDLIVKCYTEERGVLSFLLRGVLKSRKSSVKIGYFQPLTQLNIIVNYKPNKSLQTIKEVKVFSIYESLHANILKGSIVLFLSEILSSVLQEEEKNEILYSFIENTFLWLDTQDNFSNFHLLFLLKLTRYLGFYPDEKNDGYPIFNLEEGKFELKPTSKYYLSGENLLVLKQLLGTTFDALSNIKLKSKQRQSFLSMILLYFELHLGSFKLPKSLQVFNQVFS